MALRSLAKRSFLEMSRVRVNICNWDYLMGMKHQSEDFTMHIKRPSMLRWTRVSNGAKQVLGKCLTVGGAAYTLACCRCQQEAN
jgi:hypothetical protein